MSYDVILLIEQELSDLDARQVFGLHSDIDSVRYLVLMPGTEPVASAALLGEAGAVATAEAISGDPITALTKSAQAIDAREAILMTTPHVVSEFLHTDWTSKARRELNIPILHLLEHETFDQQAEGIH